MAQTAGHGQTAAVAHARTQPNPHNDVAIVTIVIIITIIVIIVVIDAWRAPLCSGERRDALRASGHRQDDAACGLSSRLSTHPLTLPTHPLTPTNTPSNPYQHTLSAGKTLLPAACAAALRCPLLELRLTDVVRPEVTPPLTRIYIRHNCFN